MCGCGGVVEAALVGYAIKKVYDMSLQSKSTSCRICHAVAIPDRDIFPECLVENTADLDTLDMFDPDDIDTVDMYPDVIGELTEDD